MSVKVAFEVRRHVEYGQTVRICGSVAELGSWDTTKALQLNCLGGDLWTGEVTLPASISASYKYVTVGAWENVLEWESGANHEVEVIASPDTVQLVRDHYTPQSTALDFVLQSAAIRRVVFGREECIPVESLATAAAKRGSGQILVRFEVNAWRVHPKDTVAVCGDIPELGNWDVSRALVMKDGDAPIWKANLLVDATRLPFNYKFVIKKGAEFSPMWEEDPHREMRLPEIEVEAPFKEAPKKEVPASPAPSKVITRVPAFTPSVIVSRATFRYPFGRGHFDFKGAGVAVPVFSLKSRTSLGIGEFNDIKVLVDWAASVDMRMIQVLPINDTSVTGTWIDSYPYSSLSVFALHPIYAHIPAIDPSNKEVLAIVEANQSEMNKGDLDYERVLNLKTELLRKIFEGKKESLKKDKELADFIVENAAWLKPYALFLCLKEEFGTTNFSAWPKHSSITEAEINDLTSPTSKYYERALYHCFVQLHLHKQLLEASQYAAKNHVVIKGDLPIGVDRNSVDTWVYPHLFNMDTSTGAPPDFFSENGQNWGFPTYNWEAMAKEDYRWWRGRLSQLDKYFHAIRIDHVLGFFRIWQLPAHAVRGMLGYFYPSVPIWRSELESAGIWDIDRLCTPQVHGGHLHDLFGARAQEVKDRFLVDIGNDYWHFKPEFSTEKAVEVAVGKDEDLKNKLFNLLSDVCLIRDKSDSNRLYPRFGLWKTNCYAWLPQDWKNTLYRLHTSYFYERQDQLWGSIGADRLSKFKSYTDMLICAEDLGMVPDCVPPVLYDLGLLGLRIQRMPKDPKREFDTPWDYPYLVVCTPSCHDSSTVRGWWEESGDATERFYRHGLFQPGDCPRVCEPWIARMIVEQHMRSACMWAIFPIQDLIAMDGRVRRENPFEEQINVPANRYHYWKYRLHMPIEDLAAAEDLSSQIRDLVRSSGRLSLY